MQAYGKNIIVRSGAAPTTSKGGIHLPASMGEQYKCRGTIVSVGTLCATDGGLDEGKTILFSEGKAFEGPDREQYTVVYEDDVLVVL